jgi:hypothetical protein
VSPVQNPGDTSDEVTARFTARSDEPVLGVPSFTADSDTGVYAIDQASYVPTARRPERLSRSRAPAQPSRGVQDRCGTSVG